MKKLPLILTSIAIIFILGKAQLYSPPHSNASELKTSYEFTVANSGQTFFELLQDKIDVAYTKRTNGIVVSGLGGLLDDNTHAWVFYRNGEITSQSLDTIPLQAGDTVRVVFENVSPQ